MAGSKDISAYLAEQQKKGPANIIQQWGEIEELYGKKYWHQLTLKMVDFVKLPHFSQGDALIKMHQVFISDFDHRIDPMSLVDICAQVLKQMEDPQKGLEFMEKVAVKVKVCEEAVLMCKVLIGNIHLSISDFPKAKEVIEDVDEQLEQTNTVTPVHGKFYKLSSTFHRLQGDHAKYYRDALRYLGCTELSDVPESEQADTSFSIGLAAILGDGIYNFGELLAHPILEALKSQADKSFLVDLLYAFNSGDIATFDKLKTQWATQPDLAKHEQAMREKISLLCLMEMTFKRPAHSRKLSFEDISKETKLPVSDVELLVMKALSLKLVKGSIDEVDQSVHMTWVQPRVLDLKQVGGMCERLTDWEKSVNKMEILLEQKANDILVQ